VRGSTAVPLEKLRELGERITELPERLRVHPRLKRIIAQRREAIRSGEGIDWATAEHLAFATLLAEGFAVRLSGEDVGRGTFSQRHAIIYDQETEERYVPLQTIPDNPHDFECVDSLLSEEAVYFDQFISSGESKWLRMSGLVCLLPHGYEGQGPEHSSARLERFLQLYAEHNIQVCYPSTPANYFHMLRRQLHRDFRKPLIVMTPKSLLRHKRCVSTLAEMGPGTSFHRVMWETPPSEADRAIERVILCSGKVYYELQAAREEAGLDGKVALIRLEQLAPFPEEAVTAELARYRPDATYVWCQEEPRNMGAWFFVAPRLENIMEAQGKAQRRLIYAGRRPSASPATGYHAEHEREQRQLVAEALGLG